MSVLFERVGAKVLLGWTGSVMIAMMERVSVGVFPLRHTYGDEHVV